MSVEDSLIEVNKFYEDNKDADSLLVKYKNKISKIEDYTNNYNSKMLQNINTSILNILKLNEKKYGEITRRDYSDFFKVLNEYGKLNFTYSLNEYRGLGIRNYCMRHTNDLSLNQYKEFCNNAAAVKKFNKIIKFADVIPSIKTALETITLPDETFTFETNITIKCNEKETQLFGQDDFQIDLKNATLHSHKESEYGFGYGNNPNIEHITKLMLIHNHADEIQKQADKIIAGMNKTIKKYKEEEEQVNNILAKWLMVGCI